MLEPEDIEIVEMNERIWDKNHSINLKITELNAVQAETENGHPEFLGGILIGWILEVDLFNATGYIATSRYHKRKHRAMDRDVAVYFLEREYNRRKP